MISPFLALNREVGAFELALIQAADELHRPGSRSRDRRARKTGDRRRRR